MKRFLLISCIFLNALTDILTAQNVNSNEYHASLFGIKSDGVNNNTASIQKAIDFIHSRGGGTLVFYVGRYVTGTVELKSNVTIRLRSGAVLVASPNIYEYRGADGQNALIYADGQENIGLEGVGTMEGSGELLLRHAEEQQGKGHVADAVHMLPALVCLDNCRNVTLKENNIQNFPATALVLRNCENVHLDTLFFVNKKHDAAAWKFSGCRQITARDCYLDTRVEPIISEGNSTQLSFNKCITLTGEEVSVDK